MDHANALISVKKISLCSRLKKTFLMIINTSNRIIKLTLALCLAAKP